MKIRFLTLLMVSCGIWFFNNCSGTDPDERTDIRLVSSDPEENAIISATTKLITFIFNQDVYLSDRGKITLNNVVVSDASTTGATLSLKFSSLEYGTNYVIKIDAGALKDRLNNLNSESFILRFRTQEAVQITRFEAESAVLSGGGANPPIIQNDANCSGGKYVATRDGKLTFTFTVVKAGDYTVLAKIRASDGDKVNTFRFNGEHAKDVSFLKNNVFAEIEIVDSYFFEAGKHTVEMIPSWGWIHFDYLEIKPSTAAPIDFDIQPLVTPQPSKNTEKLYRFLLENFQKKVISGVMTAKGLAVTTGSNQNEIAWVYEKTGKKPALMGLDFLDHTNVPESWQNNPDIIKDAITWKKSNGIVAFCWHWRDPSGKTHEFYTDRTTFDPRKIFDPASDEFKAMMRDMDVIAGYLKVLQKEDVPVLWRPLHEASGGWFWWGSQGPEACKKLWQVMFDKFTNEHQLNNLIWVWTSEANANALQWFPGDEYVDVIGMDIYREGDHSSQMLSFQDLKRIYNGKKMLALSECGSIPAMSAMKRDHSIWSFYMPWNGEMTKNAKWNSVADWTQSLNDPDVITLDDMP